MSVIIIEMRTSTRVNPPWVDAPPKAFSNRFFELCFLIMTITPSANPGDLRVEARDPEIRAPAGFVGVSALDQGLYQGDNRGDRVGRERLGVALARYERQRDELALPLYETNYQAAELTAPSARQFAARQALRGDQEEIDRLLGVMTGAVQLQQLRSAAGGR